MVLQQKPEFLRRPGLPALAYRAVPGRGPTVAFFSGFMSDMSGKKAEMLAGFCAGRGQGFVRFDYRGHGLSEGEFAAAGLEEWRDDALGVLDAATDGPLILVGSSMGGWLMLLAALARRPRVVGLVGVAAAPDFTEDLMWSELPFAERERLLRDDRIALPSSYGEQPYVITRKLIEDGRKHLLLREPIDLTCPVRLLHGMRDREVPFETSLRLADRLAAEDVTVSLIKDGDHRLSRDPDLAQIAAAVAAISAKAGF